ncbi:MAG: hypothetical protein RIS86_991 [Planctomycetota bacterium]|jgi:hypothetical protein
MQQQLVRARRQFVPWFGRFGVMTLACGLAGLPVVESGCESAPKRSTNGGAATRARSGQDDLLAPGDEVIGELGGIAGRRAAVASPSGPAASSATAPGGRGRWAVILATFTQDDHADRARVWRDQLEREFPELAGAAVRNLGRGSAVVTGGWDGPEDKGAQAELKRVKAIERGGKRPFAMAMLSRTSMNDASAVVAPRDVRNLRAKYPKVRPLLTLQVAAWSTFGERGVRYDDMRRAAERHCAELRAKGVDAWFYHDEDSETSAVTVGAFDRRAYDPKSTLYAPEVEDLMRQFPAHLLNGEPLMIPVDPTNPKGRMKPQACRLVEIPMY